ncbi:MAG: flagellar basal-body rod protein FlgG [Cyanobacteria bacterium RYN_339]|jgi:flagellar basal-body rod protein FlgG|nr:flagellar basal-body rod protein FlgG [Cyanobacteria bacterium RYN_339]
MIHGIWTAATGMQAQQMRIDTIANNLANVNTTGFKKSMVDFQDLVYQTLNQPGLENAGYQVGRGVRPIASTKLYSHGSLQVTNNPLHLAIDNSNNAIGLVNDFFIVTERDGTQAFTRDGSFKLDKDRNIVTSTGLLLSPQIQIPADATDIHIREDGLVLIRRPLSAEQEEVGVINIARFPNPAGLSAEGNNLLKASPASGDPVIGRPALEGRGLIKQGMLETSNVDIVTEMVTMIATQKSYDTASKAIQVSDKMMETANGLSR